MTRRRTPGRETFRLLRRLSIAALLVFALVAGPARPAGTADAGDGALRSRLARTSDWLSDGIHRLALPVVVAPLPPSLLAANLGGEIAARPSVGRAWRRLALGAGGPHTSVYADLLVAGRCCGLRAGPDRSRWARPRRWPRISRRRGAGASCGSRASPAAAPAPSQRCGWPSRGPRGDWPSAAASRWRVRLLEASPAGRARMLAEANARLGD